MSELAEALKKRTMKFALDACAEFSKMGVRTARENQRREKKRTLSPLDGSAGICGPLTPRPGIKPRASETCVFQREQVVTRGDARAAVADNVTESDGAENVAPVFA